jgi:hypothetical protein
MALNNFSCFGIVFLLLCELMHFVIVKIREPISEVDVGNISLAYSP